MAPNNGVAV